MDFAALNRAARRESRNRERSIPPIAVYRWWARRTSVLGRAVTEAASTKNRRRALVADPFAGGGTFALNALLSGNDVYAQDLNPWATLGMQTMLELGECRALGWFAQELESGLEDARGAAYQTRFSNGADAMISHTLRVRVVSCLNCKSEVRTYPHALVSLTRRKDRRAADAWLACERGHLFQRPAGSRRRCPQCRSLTDPRRRYLNDGRIKCPFCRDEFLVAELFGQHSSRWEIALVERSDARRRELGLPSASELNQASERSWQPRRQLGAIPDGRETGRLLRYGFSHWEDLYPRRQRVLLEAAESLVSQLKADEPHTRALHLAVWGAAEMAGHLSRWDRWFLKAFEAMSNHRLSPATLVVEPNVWGVGRRGRGSIANRLRRLAEAADWLRTQVGGPLSVRRADAAPVFRRVPRKRQTIHIVNGSSTHLLLPTGSVDLVVTDPPYHDDVQYGELSLLFRAWAALSTGRLAEEVVVARNGYGGLRSDSDYADLLFRIFQEIHRVLRCDGRLIMTYANRNPAAWIAVFEALDRARFYALNVASLHSENEKDYSKRSVRACTLDLVMELSTSPIRQRTNLPRATNSRERAFLLPIARQFMKVGQLQGGWAESFKSTLQRGSFLSPA